MNEYRIAEYNQTAAALAELQSRYGRLFDVTTLKGMEEARKARAEVRGYRVALESLRKEIKAPALERARLIDDEAKRITAELLKIEEPIDQQIKAEETRKAEERAAKARAEIARVAAIQARIAAIRERFTAAVNKTAAEITIAIEGIEEMELAPDDFAELMPEAKAAQEETHTAMRKLLDKQQAHEAEQARIIAEREELARLRQQDEERQAEQKRIDAEVKAKAEAEAAEIRKAQEAETAQIIAAQRELDERQRRIEEEEQRQAEAKGEAEAKAKAEAMAKAYKKKVKSPFQKIIDELSYGMPIDDALKMAYDMGYAEGIKVAQRAA
ncbi:MAG: hypothetical protein IPL59_08660 [Candidatus Competibacteraceae bacterium]|nr:hypothetical protein [Candidatus Competibacteraceae bacterium]